MFGTPSPKANLRRERKWFTTSSRSAVAVRQGDWKLIWRTLLPTSVDLYNLAEDPFEKNNVAAAHPDKVAAMQGRLDALGKEATKPLALMWIVGTAMKHGKPTMGSEGGKGAALIGSGGHSITDEGFG